MSTDVDHFLTTGLTVSHGGGVRLRVRLRVIPPDEGGGARPIWSGHKTVWTSERTALAAEAVVDLAREPLNPGVVALAVLTPTAPAGWEGQIAAGDRLCTDPTQTRHMVEAYVMAVEPEPGDRLS